MVSERNPLTGTGVYYPACSSEMPLAFHGVAARVHPEDYDSRITHEPQEMVATEKAFREIWKQGALFSARERVRIGVAKRSSMIFLTDLLAGDDRAVFLTLCEPHSVGMRGYHFVFDPIALLDHGASIGLNDLQGFYTSIADGLGVGNRLDPTSWSDEQKNLFAEQAGVVQSGWRYSGYEAAEWLEWATGSRRTYPLNVQFIRYVDRYVGAGMKNVIRWITTSRESALRKAEVLVDEALPLSFLVGVIFRKV